MATGQNKHQFEKLQGEVERLVYSADETGFTICRLRVPGRHDLVTVVGSLPGIQPGEQLSVEGRWLNHPKYGLQFQITRYTSQVPATANAIKRYLSSNLVKGIGPVMAGRLVDMFGDETLEVIEKSPERLTEVPGIGPKRVQGIQTAWDEQREVREVMLFLQGHGVSSAYATRIYKAYGQESVGIVKVNPYRLAQDIRGIGFLTASRPRFVSGADAALRRRSTTSTSAWQKRILQSGAGNVPGHLRASVRAHRVNTR